MDEDDRFPSSVRLTADGRRSRTLQTMTGQSQSTSVGPLPDTASQDSPVPMALTRLVWALWLVSLGALALRLRSGGTWGLWSVVASTA